jgi:choloylglycine hydrolase
VCTRIFWGTNSAAKVVSRTLDWEIDDDPDLWALPRGLERTGGAGPSSASWRSTYGSLAVSGWHVAVSEGVNERGLGAHLLYFEEAEWAPPDDRPAVANTLWVQYVLDRFATVDEALAGLADVRIVSVPVLGGRHLGAHLALEDAAGDSAVVEFIRGEMVVHHGPEFAVVANDPSYDEQLANLTRYRPFGGELPPPGDIVSLDRFVRANYFLHYLPEPADVREALAGVYHLASNVAAPFGAPYDQFGTYPTWWVSAADLTNRVYYFGSTFSPNTVWVELERLRLDLGEPVTNVDPRDPSLVGELSPLFRPAELEF